MINRIHAVHIAGLLALMGVAGCTGLNQFASTMDMAVSHVAESDKPEYEGRLESVQQVGIMTSIQFAGGGPVYDVVEAPAGLVHGDIVRIYKIKTGYTAHLWRRPDAPPTFSDAPRSSSASGS